jgi:hypothetical protein
MPGPQSVLLVQSPHCEESPERLHVMPSLQGVHDGPQPWLLQHKVQAPPLQ